MGREGLPAEGGVVLHEAPVALDVGDVDAVGRGDPLAAGVGERPVSVRAVDEVRGRRPLLPLSEIDGACFGFSFFSLFILWFFPLFGQHNLGITTVLLRIGYYEGSLQRLTIDYRPRLLPPVGELPTTKPGRANSTISIEIAETYSLE